jgi:hypothetical protein
MKKKFKSFSYKKFIYSFSVLEEYLKTLKSNGSQVTGHNSSDLNSWTSKHLKWSESVL